MADSPLVKRLKQQAKQLGKSAVREVLSGERGEFKAEAFRRVQDGRQLLDEGTSKLLATLGFANQQDVDRLGQKIGKLRKRLQKILDEVEE